MLKGHESACMLKVVALVEQNELAVLKLQTDEPESAEVQQKLVVSTPFG